MATTDRKVTVPLDRLTVERVERAARLTRQSPEAFLAWAGTEAARHVLLGYAVARYQRRERSFSELADETGLAVEEIMSGVAAAGGAGEGDRETDLDLFLASCRTVAQAYGAPEILQLGREAAEAVRAEVSHASRSDYSD